MVGKCAFRSRGGFTLVELMLVVALVGILGAISSFGVQRYLASAKTAEALMNVGAIGRAVHAAAARDTMALGSSTEGGGGDTSGNGKGNGKGNGNGNGDDNGAIVVHGSIVPGLCDAAIPVPKSVKTIAKKKYQSSNAQGVDYNTGDQYSGWTCLRFSLESPQAYQYHYQTGGAPVEVTLPHGGHPPGLDDNHTWSAAAQGDLDGDGKTSWFILEGYITDSGQVVQAPGIATENPEE